MLSCCLVSTVKVKVYEVEVRSHPNADAIELALIGDFASIIRKGQYKTGDLVAYIPEDSLLPAAIVEELGLVGKLSGPDKNKVRAIKLRGELSQGLIYPAKFHWKLGDDVAEELGITKFEPRVPDTFRGLGYGIGYQNTVKYDISNFKYFPGLFKDGEEIIITEKLHGTNCQMILLSKLHEKHNRDFFVASKGLGANGIVINPGAEENIANAYCRMANKYDVENKMKTSFMVQEFLISTKGPVIILGEVFGKGIQDLSYGTPTTFRVFDCYVGTRDNGRFLDYDDLLSLCNELALESVPELYRGPFSRKTVYDYTDGKETVSGLSKHLREGIVIRPTKERYIKSRDCYLCGTTSHCTCRSERFDGVYGRVQLKNVSGDYLTRKNGSEYN